MVGSGAKSGKQPFEPGGLWLAGRDGAFLDRPGMPVQRMRSILYAGFGAAYEKEPRDLTMGKFLEYYHLRQRLSTE